MSHAAQEFHFGRFIWLFWFLHNWKSFSFSFLLSSIVSIKPYEIETYRVRCILRCDHISREFMFIIIMIFVLLLGEPVHQISYANEYARFEWMVVAWMMCKQFLRSAHLGDETLSFFSLISSAFSWYLLAICLCQYARYPDALTYFCDSNGSVAYSTAVTSTHLSFYPLHI